MLIKKLNLISKYIQSCSLILCMFTTTYVLGNENQDIRRIKGLSKRVANAFWRGGYKTLGEVKEWVNADEAPALKSLGIEGMREIEEFIKNLNSDTNDED